MIWRGRWNAPTRFFALRDVHAGLAADGRIDHRQKRRRHLDAGDAAHVGRRGEAGEVADDTAAERDDEVGARHPQRGESAHELDVGVERLRALSGGKDDAFDAKARLFEPPHSHVTVESVDVGIGDERDRAHLGKSRDKRGRIEN